MDFERYCRTWKITKTAPDPVANVGGTIKLIKDDDGNLRCKISDDFSEGDWESAVFEYDATRNWFTGKVHFESTSENVKIIITVAGDEDSGLLVTFSANPGNSPGGVASGDDPGND